MPRLLNWWKIGLEKFASLKLKQVSTGQQYVLYTHKMQDGFISTGKDCLFM